MYMMKKVAIKETGISINGRKAIDQSLKNKKIIAFKPPIASEINF